MFVAVQQMTCRPILCTIFLYRTGITPVNAFSYNPSLAVGVSRPGIRCSDVCTCCP